MKVVAAPDKFKQSCTAAQAAQAIADGVTEAGGEAVCIPLADGGEGTLAVLSGAFPDRRLARVQDARGREVEAAFGLDSEGKVALVETAQACGLWRLAEAERNPLETSTYGVGQLIAAALDAGVEEIVVAMGGTATSDGGACMARALGAKFLDESGAEFDPVGGNLEDLRSIDLAGLDPRLKAVKVRAICDVESPMLGEGGCSRQFIVQKGGTTRSMHKLEQCLGTLEAVANKSLGRGDALQPRSGAAGAMGFGVATFLGGELEPGASCILELLDFSERIAGADLVISGEGSFDQQTVHGKLVAVVAGICREKGVKLAVLAGIVDPEVEIPGVSLVVGISAYGSRKQDAIDETLANLRRYARQVTQLCMHS